MSDRGRLTPVDVAWIGVAIFLLGLLLVPAYELMNANVGALGTGDAYLLRMVFPAALLGAFAYLFATSVEGR